MVDVATHEHCSMGNPWATPCRVSLFAAVNRQLTLCYNRTGSSATLVRLVIFFPKRAAYICPERLEDAISLRQVLEHDLNQSKNTSNLRTCKPRSPALDGARLTIAR